MSKQSPDSGQTSQGPGPESLDSFASNQLSLCSFDSSLDSSLYDNISVTSTNYPNESEDFEYDVEDILAEEVDFEGVIKYLVRWKSYPLEMCTWEPTENFKPELLEDMWEQKKRQPAFVPFDMSLYDEAYRAKTLRHIARNNKRRRLGLAETSPFLEATVLSAPLDNDISDTDLFVAAAPPTVVVQGTATASPVLDTTEIIDSGDDLVVIEELSAPAREKEKKKKRPLTTRADDAAMPLKKKKKAKDSKDGTEQPNTDTEKKENKEKKGKKKERKEKEEGKGRTEKKEKKEMRDKSEDRAKRKDKGELEMATGKSTDKCIEAPTKKPAATGEPMKKKTLVEAAPNTKGKAKAVSGFTEQRRNAPLSATSSIRSSGSCRSSGSSGSVSDRDPEGKAPAKRASIDQSAKTAAPAGTSSVPKAKPAASQNGNASTGHTKTPSGSGSASTSTSTPASASARPAKELPSLREAGPSTVARAKPAANIPAAATKTATAGVAKKAAPASQDTCGNAFSGGKRARPGRSFDAAMTNPSSTPQLFGKWSTLRRAELLERDKGDHRAIESSQLKIGLFPIASGPPANTGAGAPPNPVVEEALPPKAVVTEAPLRPSLKRPEPGSVLRRKKSVRFPDNDGSDAGLLLGRTRLKSPPVPRMENPDGTDVDEDVPMQLDPQETVAPSIALPPVPVKMLFGTQETPVSVRLDVRAESGGSEELLSRIITGKTFRFDRSFLAATFMQQVRGITKENLFSGRILADMPDVLHTVAQRLKLMASGLILVQPEHAMVVYPTQCEEWSESMFGFPAPIGDGAAAALRFVVFSTNVDCAELLRPIENQDTSYDWLSGDQDRQQVMGRFHNLSRESFLNLLPDEQAPKDERLLFLLAFPPTAKPFMWQIALWLREMHAESEVLFSTQPGAWMSFMREVEQENHAGVVIVHELATDAVRRFPYFRRLVAPGRWNARIWSISQGTYASPIFYPMYPIVAAAGDKGEKDKKDKKDNTDNTDKSDEPLPIGQISWTELFPRGLALLLTPSVILADPLLVYNLLRWVGAAAWSGKAPVTLVAAHDFCEELKQVADDKLEMLTEIMNKPDPGLSYSAVLRSASRVGAAEGHCVYRHESWVLADELCDSGMQKLISSMRGEGWPDAVVFADPCIDANDEQSLVNWFGWWSTLHMDQYRAFYVVGSENKGPHLDIMSRKVRIPDFVDTALDVAAAAEVSAPKPVYEKLRKVPTDPPAQPAAGDPRRAAPRTSSVSSTVSAPSAPRHPTQPVTLFSERLLSMNQVKCFWKVFGYVVWWRDAGEAYKNGQLNSGNHTIRDWMKYSWPFGKQHRSYVGLFNLVDDPHEAKTPASTTTSHPFVVVWRPVKPHLSIKQKETELIIWDPRASSRVRGHTELTEGEDLTSGQRAVVDFIRRHGSENNPGTFLSNVWLYTRAQTWTPETILDDESALQACSHFLDQLARDFKHVMPPTAKYLMEQGYRPVTTGDCESVAESTSTSATDTPAAAAAELAVRRPPTGPSSMRRSAPDTDTEKEKRGAVRERLVFHPPRGTSRATRCRNSLYESALLARKQDPDAATMHFTFRPTLDWYREQDDEGSGFEHVHVETAIEVCRTFGIPMRKSD